MIIINGYFATAKIMCDDAEDYAIAQVRQLCDQESFEGSKICLMPDIHPGKVGPIGFTATMGRTVMPAIVGIDIGCGMTMAKLKKKSRVEYQRLDSVIRDHVPSGSHKRKEPHRFAEDFELEKLRCADHIDKERVRCCLGTLGGGNHFIELDKDVNGDVYCIIHSGSRYLGKAVADYYLRKGQRHLKEIGEDIPYELTWLEGSLKEDYLHDMAIVVEFAELNRRAILDQIVKGMKWKIKEPLSCVHNYIDTSLPEPIIRKGAISADMGENVIIPINMRDGVILGKGMGNPEWNCSAPHGAGRILSREQVSINYTVSQFKQEMKNVYSPSVGKGTLDEAPFAYRSLDDITSAINETVEITTILKPVYNFKAGGK